MSKNSGKKRGYIENVCLETLEKKEDSDKDIATFRWVLEQRSHETDTCLRRLLDCRLRKLNILLQENYILSCTLQLMDG